MQITSQLRWVQVCQSTVSFSTSELNYKCFSYNDTFSCRQNFVFLWYVCITYGNNFAITFRFCSSLSRVFYYVKVTLFISSMPLRFFMMLELRYNLVRLNYVWKKRDNYVSFLLAILTYPYHVTIILFICSMQLRFLMTL